MKTQTFLTLTVALLSTLMMSFSNYPSTGRANNEEAFLNTNYYVEADEELEIEAWMTNDEVWGMEDRSIFVEDSATSVDEELEIEAWMTDDTLWRL